VAYLSATSDYITTVGLINPSLINTTSYVPHYYEMASRKGIFVVAGVGNGTGTGASSARIYAKAGYKIAMIARNPDDLNKVAQEIKTSFGQDVSASTALRTFTRSETFLSRRKDSLSKNTPIKIFTVPSTLSRNTGLMKKLEWPYGMPDRVYLLVPYLREILALSSELAARCMEALS
jgi:hypothetical protein